MIELQYYTFWWQNVSSSIIYVLSLIAIGVLINLNPSWAYDPNVILGNEDFNVFLITTIIMGLLSLVFAKNPSWIGLVNSMMKSEACQSISTMLNSLQELDEEDDNAEEEQEYDDTDGMVVYRKQYETWSPERLSIEKGLDDKSFIDANEGERNKIKYEIPSEDVVLRKEKNVTFCERAWIKSFQHSSSKNFHQDRSSIQSWVETSSPRAIQTASANFNDENSNENYDCPEEFDHTDGRTIGVGDFVNERKYECMHDTSHDSNEDLFAKKNKNFNCAKKIHKEWIVRIFIGLTCIAFVLAPMIIAALFMNLGTNRSAYIYHTHENETTITQVNSPIDSR